MKTSIKVFALLLSLLMVAAMFAGCQKSDATPSAAPTAAPSAAASQAPSEEPGLPYPQLTEEPVELTVWQTFTADYIASMNDSDFIAELAKRTNVTLKFQEASSADAVTAFNLMINSGDYTDIVRPGANEYPGGPDKAIEDGIYLKLNELVDKYAPNYSAQRNSTPDVARQTITDAGNMWSIYTLALPAEYPWTGYAIRKDILDKKGVALPVTLKDWETALQTFVDEGVDFPLLMDVTGVSLNAEFLSAWNVGKQFYMNNGKVMYGYIQPEFKEYLTMMNDWYKKGYLDRDFTSHGITFSLFPQMAPDAYAALVNGEAGAAQIPWGFTDVALSLSGQAKPEGFNLAAVSAPKMNAGDQINFRFTSYEAKTPNAITSACENPEIAVKLMDYLFTEEGSILMNYGIEGVSYTMVDGKPRYTETILLNPDGFQARSVAMKYAWDDGIGMNDFKRLWQKFEGTPSEGALNAYNVWNQDSNANMLPPITRTAEEGQEYSAVYNDIQTFAHETIPMFIIGTKPLSEFDAFVAQIKSMNIDRAIEIQQAALDRYMAR